MDEENKQRIIDEYASAAGLSGAEIYDVVAPTVYDMLSDKEPPELSLFIESVIASIGGTLAAGEDVPLCSYIAMYPDFEDLFATHIDEDDYRDCVTERAAVEKYARDCGVATMSAALEKAKEHAGDLESSQSFYPFAVSFIIRGNETVRGKRIGDGCEYSIVYKRISNVNSYVVPISAGMSDNSISVGCEKIARVKFCDTMHQFNEGTTETILANMDFLNSINPGSVENTAIAKLAEFTRSRLDGQKQGR